MFIREELAAEINPIFEAIREQMTPLMTNHKATTEAMVESMFRQSHPEFDAHIDTARSVAQALNTQFPNEVKQMTPQQFVAEVARQTERAVLAPIKATNPWFSGSLKEWNELAKKMAEQFGQPPAAPAAPAAAPAAPAAPPKPAVIPRVPAANPPAGPELSATHPDMRGAKGWSKAVASSLID